MLVPNEIDGDATTGEEDNEKELSAPYGQTPQAFDATEGTEPSGPPVEQPSKTQEEHSILDDVETGKEESSPETADKPLTVPPEKPSDLDLIARAEEHFRQDRLLDAARVLHTVQNKELLQEQHHAILQKAAHCEAAVVDLTSSITSAEWTKQGESHGDRDFIIYYKIDEASRLTARIETPIELSLLVPLLSVFNETELYQTWMPRFKRPFKMGVSKSVKLRQSSRANQIIAVTSDMPWPIANREAIIDATAIDDIDANGHILVKMETRYEGDEDGLIPPPDDGVVRIDFDGGILFRKCPKDHPALLKSKHPDHKGELILACLTMFVDSKLKFAPQNLINFCTRTIIGRMWAMLLHVAEGIQKGERPQHAEAIAAKREVLYDWVDQRIQVMLDSIQDEATIAAA